MLLIVIILGVYYARRRFKVERVVAADLPDVPPEIVEEWRELELSCATIVLWATWGTVLASFPAEWIARKWVTVWMVPHLPVGLMLLCFSFLIKAMGPGEKAAKLKKKHAIRI